MNVFKILAYCFLGLAIIGLARVGYMGYKMYQKHQYVSKCSDSMLTNLSQPIPAEEMAVATATVKAFCTCIYDNIPKYTSEKMAEFVCAFQFLMGLDNQVPYEPESK